MKLARLGDFVQYDGRIAQVIGIAEGRSAILRYLENPPCEHCGRVDPDVELLEGARLFQERVEPVPTMEVEP